VAKAAGGQDVRICKKRCSPDLIRNLVNYVNPV
jgi:hypothetical protein